MPSSLRLRRAGLCLLLALSLAGCAGKPPPEGASPSSAAAPEEANKPRVSAPAAVLIGVVVAVGLVALAISSGSKSDSKGIYVGR